MALIRTKRIEGVETYHSVHFSDLPTSANKGDVGFVLGPPQMSYQWDGSVWSPVISDFPPLFRRGRASIATQVHSGSLTTAETTLYSNSVDGNTLVANGDSVTAVYQAAMVNSSSTKQLRMYFGGTMIFDSTALTVGAGGIAAITAFIVRDSANSVRYSITGSALGASASSFVTGGTVGSLNFANPLVVSFTAQSAGAGVLSGDIVGKFGVIQLGDST